MANYAKNPEDGFMDRNEFLRDRREASLQFNAEEHVICPMCNKSGLLMGDPTGNYLARCFNCKGKGWRPKEEPWDSEHCGKVILHEDGEQAPQGEHAHVGNLHSHLFDDDDGLCPVCFKHFTIEFKKRERDVFQGIIDHYKREAEQMAKNSEGSGMSTIAEHSDSESSVINAESIDLSNFDAKDVARWPIEVDLELKKLVKIVVAANEVVSATLHNVEKFQSAIENAVESCQKFIDDDESWLSLKWRVAVWEELCFRMAFRGDDVELMKERWMSQVRIPCLDKSPEQQNGPDVVEVRKF